MSISKAKSTVLIFTMILIMINTDTEAHGD